MDIRCNYNSSLDTSAWYIMDIRRDYNGTIISMNLIHFVEYACLVSF